MGELLCGEEKKRIGVYLEGEPHMGGGFQYTQFILDALLPLQNKYEIFLIFSDLRWSQSLGNEYPFIVSYVEPGQSFSDNVDKLNCDVIICTTQACGLGSYIMTPTINVIHDLMHRYETAFPEVSAKREFQIREESLVNICELSLGIFADSDLGKQHILESYGNYLENRIHVLPFRVPNYLADGMEEKVCPLKNKKFIFYPAQFWSHKNHINLLLAMDILRQEGTLVNFVFVGSDQGAGNQVERLVQSLGLMDQVQVLGYVENAQMKYLYQHARAMVMPSFFGPTNIPPLEGMYMACPVAVANVYAMPEQVGKAGLTFDPKVVSDIAQVLKRLWLDDDLCNNLIKRGKEQIKKFSTEEFNKKFAFGVCKFLDRMSPRNSELEGLMRVCRKCKRVYLYGAGGYGRDLYFYLLLHSISIEGFIVSRDVDAGDRYMGRTVCSWDKSFGEDRDGIVVLAMSEENQKDVQLHVELNRNVILFTEIMHDAVKQYLSNPSVIRKKQLIDILSK